MPSRCRVRISTRVWGCTPSTAETTSTAPSSTPSTRSTSAMKSGWPGVSIRLTVVPPTTNDTTADLMVMPRWRSRASESVWVLPASTLPTSSMTPGGEQQPLGQAGLPGVDMGQDPQVEYAHDPSSRPDDRPAGKRFALVLKCLDILPGRG